MKVRHIDQGINPISVGKLYFSGKYFTEGIRIGLVAGMVALTVSGTYKQGRCHLVFFYFYLNNFCFLKNFRKP